MQYKRTDHYEYFPMITIQNDVHFIHIIRAAINPHDILFSNKIIHHVCKNNIYEHKNIILHLKTIPICDSEHCV